MSAAAWRRLGAVFALAGGVVAIGLAFYIHSSHPWTLGGTWQVAGIVVSAQRLLAAVGLVMIIGGLVLVRSSVAGGIVVTAPLVVALAFAYTHAAIRAADLTPIDVRMNTLRVLAAPLVLGLLAAVCAGLALQDEIVPVGAEAEPGTPPAAPFAVPPAQGPAQPEAPIGAGTSSLD